MLETIRDVAVIILAVMGIAAFAAIFALALLLYSRLGPLLNSAQRTVENIQGTTQFITETTVHPIIRIASFLSGIRAGVGVLGRFKRR